MVLYVDDSELRCNTVVRQLAALRMPCQVAADTRAACAQLAVSRPDAIVVDAIDSAIDGLRSLHRLRDAGYEGLLILNSDRFSPATLTTITELRAVPATKSADNEALLAALNLTVPA
jgi:CheY-like chemotaxis protein